MSPQARLIAYYIVRNEVVVDSTIIEVGQSFPNQVCLSNNRVCERDL